MAILSDFLKVKIYTTNFNNNCNKKQEIKINIYI